jgi:hypothetical protein
MTSTLDRNLSCSSHTVQNKKTANFEINSTPTGWHTLATQVAFAPAAVQPLAAHKRLLQMKT